MSARPTLLSVLALGLASAACEPAAPLSEEDVAAIRAVAESYAEAQLANDVAALAAHYAEDAVQMPPNEPVVEGLEAIRAGLESEEGTVTEYSNTPVMIDGRDGLAYARGDYSIAVTMEGVPEPVRDSGKYLVTLQKQADGRWLLTNVIWNSDQPLPE